MLLQCAAQGALQISIQVKVQGVPGLRGSLHSFDPRMAAPIHRHFQASRSAAQSILPGGFQPPLADGFIHGKALGLFLCPLLGTHGPHAAQQLRSEGAIHRRAGTAGSQPHRPALGQTGSQQALALCLGQIFSQRQFPRRNGRTKGGKLCFHILAA